MNRPNDHERAVLREKAIYRYVEALDRAELEIVAEVIGLAIDDPELSQAIIEVNSAFQQEMQLTPLSADAEIVRTLIHEHPRSGELADTENLLSTVGEVAAKLKSDRRVPFAEERVNGITELLIQWSDGDQTALEQLMPLVERELRSMARNFMRKENPGHTLQATALVNETYLKLVDQKRAQWQNRTHFFAIAAQIMRRILLDYAKKRNRAKRGGQLQQVSISDRLALSNEKSEELIALDEALVRLSAVDPLLSKITELRYFGGLGVDETAEVLGIAPITVMRHWKMARAWLRREIGRGFQS